MENTLIRISSPSYCASQTDYQVGIFFSILSCLKMLRTRINLPAGQRQYRKNQPLGFSELPLAIYWSCNRYSFSLAYSLCYLIWHSIGEPNDMITDGWPICKTSFLGKTFKMFCRSLMWYALPVLLTRYTSQIMASQFSPLFIASHFPLYFCSILTLHLQLFNKYLTILWWFIAPTTVQWP